MVAFDLLTCKNELNLRSKSKVQTIEIMKPIDFRCNGGDPLAAWRYWVRDGIVTGSNYTQHSGCKPYPFPPCE